MAMSLQICLGLREFAQKKLDFGRHNRFSAVGKLRSLASDARSLTAAKCVIKCDFLNVRLSTSSSKTISVLFQAQLQSLTVALLSLLG